VARTDAIAVLVGQSAFFLAVASVHYSAIRQLSETVCAEALAAERLEVRGRRGVQMAHGNENAAAHLRVCFTFTAPCTLQHS
jgi:hypothetical protein